MDRVEKSEEQGPGWRPLRILLLTVLLAWTLFGWLALTQPLVEPGIFGDMFGAANALFSALAFAALIYTVVLQRAELKLQRLELRQTRAELKGQREQLELQNDLMRADAFENSFFRVLTVLNDIVNATDLVGKAGTTRGRDCFDVFYRSLASDYKTTRLSNRLWTERNVVRGAYEKFYEARQRDIGHYFRTLYNLVKLVDRSSVKDKHFYTNLIRAQLSDQETLLLFYNCTVGIGEAKFKELVERYALLKNMPRNKLFSIRHLTLFSEAAYGREALSDHERQLYEDGGVQ